MANIIIKRYTGSTWEAHYPKTTIGQVTNLSTTLADMQNDIDAKVPTTRTIAGKALSSNVWLSTADIDDDDAQQSLDRTLYDLQMYKLSTSAISAWAKAASKPSYSWSEIGSKPAKIIRQVSFSDGKLVVEVV